MAKHDINPALNHLKKDPVISQLIEKLDEPIPAQEVNLYLDILDSIVSQQLSVKAAATIFKRFIALFSSPVPSPQEILQKSDEELRSAGLSYQKIKYIKSLAQAIQDKSLDLEKLKSLSDEEVIVELTKIKGIGRWTAEMILIFSLQRQDVFSVGDLGLRTAVATLYNVNREDLKTIEEISKSWSPYRSLASRYLWKSLDNMPKEKKSE